MHSLGRLLIAVLVVAAGAGPLAPAAPTGEADGSTASVGAPSAVGVAAAATPGTPTNNTTRHENPDEVNEKGNLDDVKSWLGRRLAQRLEAGAVNLSQRQYEVARRLVGQKYRDRYGKYVDVAGETATKEDDRTAKEFREARREQRNLTTAVREYRETLRKYREARRNGNEERARRLARKLERLAERIDRSADDLARTYRNISNGTNVDLSEGIDSIQQVERNVTSQQQEVVNQTFVRTRIVLNVASRNVSFLDPVQLSGRLVTANGSALANRSVVLRIGGRTVRVRTNATGGFTVAFRPTTMPVGRQTVRVAYRPRNVSIYLGSSANVSVNVSRVDASATIVERSSTVAFGDDVTVRGRVAAGGVGAQGVPVVVTLGGVRLGTATTGPNGTFRLRVPLPVGVENGTRQLRVAVPLEGRALNVSAATAKVDVESTTTELSVTAKNGTGQVRVSGTLRTADGTPVPNQQVALFVGGRRIATVRTDGDGSFSTTISPPNGTGTVTVVVRYAGTGTNLEPSQASASATLLAGQGPQNQTDTRLPLTSLLAWLLAGAVVLLGGGAAVVLYRRESDTTPQGGSATGDASADPQDLDDAGFEPSTPVEPAGPSVSVAREQLDDGDLDAAVGAAYVATRRALAAETDVADAGTHWEFLRAVERDGVDAEGLADLTTAYEQAAFAPGGVDRETAVRAVEVATDLGETAQGHRPGR